MTMTQTANQSTLINNTERSEIYCSTTDDVSGVWRSKYGCLLYVITHYNNRICWKALQNGDVVKTAMGWFPKITTEAGRVKIEAQWNLGSEQPGGSIPIYRGEVILYRGNLAEICWKDENGFSQAI